MFHGETLLCRALRRLSLVYRGIRNAFFKQGVRLVQLLTDLFGIEIVNGYAAGRIEACSGRFLVESDVMVQLRPRDRAQVFEFNDSVRLDQLTVSYEHARISRVQPRSINL